MSAEATAGTDMAPAASADLTFHRPAELVDIAERLYRGVFAIALWVAVGGAALGIVGSLLQAPGGHMRSAFFCLGCLAAIGFAATRSAALYDALRRRPWALLIPAALLGTGALVIGVDNYQLLVLMSAVVGGLGVATPLPVVASAALIAAAGLGAPHVTVRVGDVVGVIGVLVPPFMFWLIVDRIAAFALRLHQTLAFASAAGTAAAPGHVDVSGPRASTRSAPTQSTSTERPGLPAPQVIMVDATRLTSRQLQVVLLACEGLKHGQIAACLGIGTQQVRRHLRTARERTASDNTVQLVAWARRTGLVPRTAQPDEAT